MARYTVRITNDEEGIVAWIDADGLKCIKQPHLPGETEGWKSEAEAKAWADKHAIELEAQHIAAIEAEEKKRAFEDLQIAAAQAQIDTADALKAQNAALLALVEKLTNPTA